jgi:hypothetical protein
MIAEMNLALILSFDKLELRAGHENVIFLVCGMQILIFWIVYFMVWIKTVIKVM